MRFLRYESHSKGTILLREGLMSMYVYILIDGQVKIIKTGVMGPVEAGMLNAGTAFGRPEPASPLRRATYVCNVASEFLVVDIGIIKLKMNTIVKS